MTEPNELSILRVENQRLREDIRCLTAERDALRRTVDVPGRVSAALGEWADKQKPRHAGPQ